MSLKSVLVLACIASASAFSKLRACAGFNYDECGVCRGPGIAPGTCDCDGTLPDCANICGGTSTFDVCGVCGGPGLTGGICDCLGNVDVGCGCGEPGPTGCDEACGSTAVEDECGECGGTGIPDSECDCDGNVVDECGTCGGTGIPEGECDCEGNVEDECGVCGGTGIPEGECDCFQNVEDECGICGGDGIPEGECDCEGNVDDICGVCGGDGSDDQGCGCGEPAPSGCDETCGSELENDECGVCGGIGITDQMCACVAADTGVPDFTCIPSDPAEFKIGVDSQQGVLSVDKSFTFSIDLGEPERRSRALNENNWCIKGYCETSEDFPRRDREACDTCDGTEKTIIVGFEVKVTQELSGLSVAHEYTLEEIFIAGGTIRNEDNPHTPGETEESYLDRYSPELAFARDRQFSIDIKSCGQPRFNEATNECDPYEVWTGGDTLDGEEDEKCFSNVCTGMPEFDDSGDSRTDDIIYFRQNSYVVKVRSIGCEGTVGDITDPINTCNGAIRKGSFDDYCYEDLLYNRDVQNVDEAAELYQARKDSDEDELCPSLEINAAYNKIEGTQGQGVFVIDFNKDCDSEAECANSCPAGQCEYPEIDSDACTEVDSCAGCNFDGNGDRLMEGMCEYNGDECFLKDEEAAGCTQDCHCVAYSFENNL